MTRFLVLSLLCGAVLGLRKRSRASIQAATGMDTSGRWATNAIPDLFGSASLSVTLPGKGETHFKCRKSRSASIAADFGLEVMEGSDGVAHLTAVKQSSGFIAGSIVDPESGIVHQFSGKEGGELHFKSTPSADFPPEADPVGSPDVGGVEKPPPPGNATSAQVAVMDTMVLWTRNAECDNAGLSAGCGVTSSTYASMLAKVELAVVETNQAFANSRINAQLRLAHYYRTSYEPTAYGHNFNTALDVLTQTNDGYMDQVHAERTQYGADIVVLLVALSQYCGLGWVGPTYANMFSVTQQGCATGYYSFGHEIGHNLGLSHDRGSQNACSTSDYRFGWRDPQGAFRTIMAYDCQTGQCDNIAKNGCTRVQYWSNPAVYYSGRPTGSAYADAARRINSVAPTVAAYTGGGNGPAPSPGGCQDTAEYAANCPAWAGAGYCSPSAPEYQFMRDHCSLTCGFCGNTPAPTPPSPPPTPPSPPPSGGCQDTPDYAARCPAWQAAGYCSPSSENYQFMQDHCRLTCGDLNDNCPGWAGAGYCSPSSEYYQFMMENCCGSCGR